MAEPERINKIMDDINLSPEQIEDVNDNWSDLIKPSGKTKED